MPKTNKSLSHKILEAGESINININNKEFCDKKPLQKLFFFCFLLYNWKEKPPLPKKDIYKSHRTTWSLIEKGQRFLECFQCNRVYLLSPGRTKVVNGPIPSDDLNRFTISTPVRLSCIWNTWYPTIAPFWFFGSRQDNWIVVAVTSLTVTFNGLLGTARKRKRHKIRQRRSQRNAKVK